MTNRIKERGGAFRTLCWTLTLVSGGMLFGGCLYDPDDRCGPNQELSESGDICVCVAGAAQVGRECVVCGENEVPGEGSCECADGFAKNGAGACVPGFEGFTDECADDSDCPTNGASRCVTSVSGSFCSLDCESASDCPSPAGCDLGVEQPHCVPAPTGLDAPCTSSGECGQFEANYCETMLENKCKVECKSDPDVCHGDWVCCDYSTLIGAALCVSPSDLDEGKCPFGGQLLESN